MHYAGFSTGPNSGPVEVATLQHFHAGRGFAVHLHPTGKFKRSAIASRARSRVGENLYNLFSNNCEHFVHWCVYADHKSPQVEKATALAGPGGAVVVGHAVRSTVFAAGPVAGLSGSGAMGGLAQLGALVGGGAVAGIALAGGAGGAIAAEVMNRTVLADSPVHSDEERSARAIARKATYAGAGATTFGGVATISFAGTTSGLSAAGITSGLAAIGSTVGGGLVTGIVLTTTAPVAVAVGAGLGIYKLVKWLREP